MIVPGRCKLRILIPFAINPRNYLSTSHTAHSLVVATEYHYPDSCQSWRSGEKNENWVHWTWQYGRANGAKTCGSRTYSHWL